MESVLQTLVANWAVIAQAPYAFALWTVVIIGAAWGVLSYLKADQTAVMEARLKLRDDRIAELELNQSAAPAPPAELPESPNQNRRRVMIEDGRRLVAEFNAQSGEQTLLRFLGARAEWHAIRAQPDPKVRVDMENGFLVVATRGDVKDGKVYYLMRELDRLEQEWGLI